MAEYIFEIKNAVYNGVTGEVSVKPKCVGELIRCKDCIHYTGKWCTKYSTKEIDINDVRKSDNDFCSQAERKEE